MGREETAMSNAVDSETNLAREMMEVDLKRTTIAEVLANLDALVDRVAETGERIILTRNGKEVAALVHVDDARYMQVLEDREDSEAAAEALAEAEIHGTIPWEQIEARLDR